VNLPQHDVVKLHALIKEHERTRLVTKGVQIGLYDDYDIETRGMIMILLGMLKHLERVCQSNCLWLHEALILTHSSGDSLLHLQIHLEDSQKYMPEILSLIGRFHRLQTLHIDIDSGEEDTQETTLFTPITLPALRSMNYAVDCNDVSPWVCFLGRSNFPELRTLRLMVNGPDGETVSLCAVHPLLEQHPRLQRLVLDLSFILLRKLLAQPISVCELAITVVIDDELDVPMLTLPPMVATLELYQSYKHSFQQQVDIVRAIVAGLAAHAHGQLRCIRLGGAWDVVLGWSGCIRRGCAYPPGFLPTDLADAKDMMQLVWRAQDLGAFNVTLHDCDGKRLDECTQYPVRSRLHRANVLCQSGRAGHDYVV
jgi:hypothetical protein